MEIQVVSGFMGAGKTTYLNNYLPTLPGKTAVIMNDDGNIKLDESKVTSVKYMTSGCICCTLVEDFRKVLRQVCENEMPDRIVIEAAGIGKLSDVVKACLSLKDEGIDLEITKKITLVEAPEYECYAEGLGEFYLDQIKEADEIILTHTEDMSREEILALGTEVGALGTEVGALGTEVGALGTEVKALGTEVSRKGTEVSRKGTEVRYDKIR